MRQKFIVLISYLLPVFIVFFVVGVSILVTRSTLFEVKEIQVVGNKDIFSSLDTFKKKRNLLLVSVPLLKQEIKRSYPLVQDAIIRKQFPSSLRIEVVEREPVFRYNSSEMPLLIDGEGFLIPVLVRFQNKTLIQLSCEAGKIDSGKLTDTSLISLLAFAAQLRKDLFLNITNVSCTDTHTTELKIGKTTVKATLPIQNPQTLSNSLQFLFKQFRIEGKYPDVVDLRFAKPVLIPDEKMLETPASDSTHIP